jgi:adenylate cyclase
MSAVNELKRSYGELFIVASRGELAVENASPGFGHPVMIVGIPDLTHKGRMLVAYLNSSSLMESFRSTRASEIFQVMLVNDRGLVIAHTDDRETLSRSNLKDVPIVKSMLESGSGNGSRIYESAGKEYLGAYQNMTIGGLSVISMVDGEEVFSAVNLIRIQNIIITAIVLTLAFMGIFFFTRTISKPIVHLVEATKEIEKGNYSIKIKPVTRDEVGILTEAFRHMSKGLAERELIKDTFGKFANEEIAERAIKGGIQLGGDKKIATVLFSDMRNFTPLSESRDPARVVELLNGYFTGMVECVHNTGGIVDKFIGDAIMAHWGSLQTAENDTEGAVDAALQMREALLQFNRMPENTDLPTIHVGIGINTGMVIAGQIGSERKLEFTVIGDTVNLASRIEFLNKHFGTDILISSATYEFVKDIYDLHEMPPISIKGKSKPETVYAVLGRLDDPTRPRSLDELRRKIELEFNEDDQRKSMAISADHLADGSSSKKGK